MKRITINTEPVVLSLVEVLSRKYKGKEIKIYQLERGGGSGYYVAEIGPKKQYDEIEGDENMNEQNRKTTIEQMIIIRGRGNSESLLSDDERFEHFVERVTNEANKLIEYGGYEIVGISYPTDFKAIIIYR